MNDLWRSDSRRNRGGFTLLELLTATAMFAVIVVALYTVFYGALRMRERAHDTFEERLPKDALIALLWRDLSCAPVPGGILVGAFLGEKIEEGGQRLDRLELYTASATVDEKDPWGDIQKVVLSAETPEDADEVEGRDLVRETTRNLLASTEQEPEEQRLLHGLESLAFQYYDGKEWQDSWDSTTQENALPLAVRIQIRFQSGEEKDRSQLPIDFIVPMAAGTSTTESAQEESSDASGGGVQ
jgi:general secretion pathway protein J